MTRENKIGLVVCGSFLCLVGALAAVKITAPPATDAPPPPSPTLAMAGVAPQSVEDRNQAPPHPEPAHSPDAAPAVPEPMPDPMPPKVDPPPANPPPPAVVEPPPMLPPPVAPPTVSPALPSPPSPPTLDPPPAPPGPVALDPPPAAPPGPPTLDPPPAPPGMADPPLAPPPSPPPAVEPDHKSDDGPKVDPHSRHDQNHIKTGDEGHKNVVAIEPPPPPVEPPSPPPVEPPAPPAPVKPQDPPPPPSVGRIEPPPPSVVAPPGPPTVKIEAPTAPEPSPAKPVIVIPAAAHPPAPPLPTNPIAVAPGTAIPTTPAAVTPLVDSWDERTYVCQSGDSFLTIADKQYPGHGPDYAAALQLYNRNHPRAGDLMRRDGTITPGVRIYVPQSSILEKRYPDAVARPKPLTAATGVGDSGAVQASFPTKTDPPAAPTYKVLGQGESLLGIAASQLKDGNRWKELAELNPGVNPETSIPPGTELRLPASGK